MAKVTLPKTEAHSDRRAHTTRGSRCVVPAALHRQRSVWFPVWRGAQKVASEEGIAFTLTDMAVKGRLRAIAAVFLMTFHCV